MFDFKRAMNSKLETHPDDVLIELSTPWGEALDTDRVLTEYPRPQLQRHSYINLNGWWDHAFADGFDRTPPESYDGKILVPFSPEAALSGVCRQLQPDETLWYHRSFTLPIQSDHRCILHFEAVDYSCECFVNGYFVGTHCGGYDPFCYDITDYVKFDSDQTNAEVDVVLAVQDPSEYGMQPRGKQRLDRGSIWYTAQSGIWQTVWLEIVPASYIKNIDVHADPDTEMLHIRVECAGTSLDGSIVTAELWDDGMVVAQAHVETSDQNSADLELAVPAPHLWSPEDPYLYDIHITYGQDEVTSYCAFRSFSCEAVAVGNDEHRVFCLNHQPYVLRGILDQGYWSDGLMTAPHDDALIFDIKIAKELGFNMMRKHLKVECARWYYHCDRLGMIVWQDMVNGGDNYPDFYTSVLPTVSPQLAKHMNDTKDLARFGSEKASARYFWKKEAQATIRHLKFFPCIGTWTVFNEGWGQFDAEIMTAELRSIDSTRPFDQASGWFDQGGGDYISQHNYFRTLVVPKGLSRQDRRAPVLSEYGGLGFSIPGHSAVDRSYGYGQYQDPEAFTEDLIELMKQIRTLETKGLAGSIFTQLSDIEEEVNGLITYDRRILKA